MGYNLDTNRLNTSRVSSLPGLLSDAIHWQMMKFVIGLVITSGVFATAANIVTITVYFRLGFSDSTNISLTALAISDLGIAVTTVTCALAHLFSLIPGVTFTPQVFLPISVHPHILLSRISALITTYLGLERYLCVLCPLKIRTIITPKRTFVVMVIIFAVTFSVYPINVIEHPIGWRFFPEMNRTLLDILPNSDPTVSLMYKLYLLIFSTLLPFITFFLVVIFTILLSLSLMRSKAWRDANKSRPTTSTAVSKTQTRIRSAVEQSKEDRAVKMAITVASVFIVSTIPSCVQLIAVLVVPEFAFAGRYTRLYTVLGLAYFGVDSINSGANVIIYYTMSRKFRGAMLALFRGRNVQSRHSIRLKHWKE